jgi:outer membrane protein TolC
LYVAGTPDAVRSAESTRLTVTRLAVVAYYDLAASIALVESTERSEAVARESLRILGVRRGAGLSSDLDVARAEAEADRRPPLAADARRRRNDPQGALALLTGREIYVPPIDLETSVDAEAALDVWLARTGTLPAVRAADASAEAARADRAAARAGMLPTLSASLSERFTSAPGFGVYSKRSSTG